MDALELLKKDHDHVNALFKNLSTADSKERKRGIFENIRSELERHTHAEETVFYPALKKFDQFKELIEESYNDHRIVKDLLIQIEASLSNMEEFDSKTSELQDNVEHHVEEEENELFPQVRKLMRSPEREQLGRHIQAAKEEKAAA